MRGEYDENSCVEDEKEIADGICRILESSGYQVDCIYDGLVGLDYIFSEIYDLVLLRYEDIDYDYAVDNGIAVVARSDVFEYKK